MTFTGFPDAAFEFYEGLEVDNSKAYWQDHKAIYETAVKGPLTALLAELEPEFGQAKVFQHRQQRIDRAGARTVVAADLLADGLDDLVAVAGLARQHLQHQQLQVATVEHAAAPTAGAAMTAPAFAGLRRKSRGEVRREMSGMHVSQDFQDGSKIYLERLEINRCTECPCGEQVHAALPRRRRRLQPLPQTLRIARSRCRCSVVT